MIPYAEFYNYDRLESAAVELGLSKKWWRAVWISIASIVTWKTGWVCRETSYTLQAQGFIIADWYNRF